MPRPRILGAPPCKPRNVDKSGGQKTTPKVITINDSEEPDCEIIEIDDVDATGEAPGLRRAPETIKVSREQTKDVRFAKESLTGLQYCGSQLSLIAPPMLPLQLVPNTPSIISTNTENVYGRQNVMMVLPVSTALSQIFNPTLCTLRKIENPNEISQIRQVVGIQQNVQLPVKNIYHSRSTTQQSNETRKKVLQGIFAHNSAESLRRTRESQVSCVTKEPIKSTEKLEVFPEKETDDKVLQDLNTSDSTTQELNSSIVEFSSNLSVQLVDCFGNSSQNRKEKNSRSTEPSTSGNVRDVSPIEKFSNPSSSLGNPKKSIFASKKSNDSSNNSRRQNPTISSSEILIDDASLLERVKVTTSVSKRPTDGVNSVDNRSGSVMLTKKQTDSRNSSKTRESLSPATALRPKVDKKSVSSKTLQATALGMKNCKKGGLWKVQCIACKKNFTDRTELHRHATLAHPDVQILFCQHCSDSFLTYSGLKAHYTESCNPEIAENFADEEMLETIVKENKDDPRHSTERAKKLGSVKTGPQPGNSRNNDKTRQIERKITASIAEPKNLQISHPSGVMYIATKRGRPRKNFGTSAGGYKYVEEEVINHAAVATKKQLVSAEIKKLVVPLTRLEAPTLEKYLGKHAEKPVTVFHEERGNKRGNLRKKNQRRRWRRNNYNNVGNVRKIRNPTKKLTEIQELTNRPQSTTEETKKDTFLRRDEETFTHNSSQSATERPIDDNSHKTSVDAVIEAVSKVDSKQLNDSEVNQIIGVEGNDLGKKDQRPIIRKLTSRSSAASIVLLRIDDKQREPRREGESLIDMHEESTLGGGKNDVWSTVKKKSLRKNTEPENAQILPARSDAESLHDTRLEEFDPEQFEDISKESNKDNVQEVEQTQQPIKVDLRQQKTSSSKKSIAPSPISRKTYLPSKKKASIAVKSKRQLNSTCYDLCLMCKELFALMKQLANQFVGNNANRISVKCPLCQLYFISMFYLQEHIAKYHLHCQTEIPCKQAKTLLIARSLSANAALDCETEVELALECQQCSMKFSEENDLNNHVFTQHDMPIYYEDTATEAPHFVSDLPSSCFQKFTRVNMVQSESRRSDNKNVENRPNIERVLDADLSKSMIEKAANDSSEAVEDSTRNSFLNCPFCEFSFANASEYICHVKNEHNSLSLSSAIIGASKSTKSPSHSSEANLTSLRIEPESYCSREIPPASETNAKDESTADREYLLKQLLSDDSRDNFEDMETARKSPKQYVIKPKKGITHSNCKICYKGFKSAQDFLTHSLEHDSSVSGSSQNTSEVPKSEINGLFADSLEDSNDVRLAGSSALASTTEASNTTTLISKPIDNPVSIDDDIFASGNEINDSSPVHESNEGSKIEHIDLKHKKTASLDTKSSSKSDKTKKECLRESKMPLSANSAVKATPEVTEPLNEKFKVLKELLETEEGLANTDDLNANGKLPIECSKCNRKFPNQASLNEHLFFLHDDSLKDTVLTDVVSPMSRTGGENSTEPRHWRCNQCSHKFKLLQSYSRHRYFVHGDDEMVHVCENCCKVMSTVTMVNVHICTDVASYNCRTCNETFPTGMSLRLHNTDKHMEHKGPHMCLPCNKKFLTNAMLKRHEQWKHRFFRPYRPRKSSPVHMATRESVSTKSDDCGEIEMDSGCDQEYVDMEYEFTSREAAQDRKRASESLEVLRKKRRGSPIMKVDNPPKTKIRALRETLLGWNRSTTYIDENEIYQCSLCRLYCLSKAALRTHEAKSHSIMAEVCRVCKKMYSKGKLIRHMIDQHVNPCRTYTDGSESIWDVGKNIEEKDAEELIRTLGIRRLMSLSEYQRYSESTEDGSVACPICGQDFKSSEAYKYHFFMNHDVMCALCNIEFKSGNKAARHKIEDHGSASSYIWFANKTVKALSTATNFVEVVEQIFIEMISRESDASSSESHEGNDDLVNDAGEQENPTCTEKFMEGNHEVAKSSRNTDKPLSLSKDFAETDDKKLIIVVTDEDLEKYEIGTQNPNIWGLASKISSTSEELTPTDVKSMLESYFER